MTTKFNMKAIGLSLLCLAVGAIFLFTGGQAKATVTAKPSAYTVTIKNIPGLTTTTTCRELFDCTAYSALYLLTVDSIVDGDVELSPDNLNLGGWGGGAGNRSLLISHGTVAIRPQV